MSSSEITNASPGNLANCHFMVLSSNFNMEGASGVQFYREENGVKETLTTDEYLSYQRSILGKAYFQFHFDGANFKHEGVVYGAEKK